jgi:competence protein ComEC
VIPGLADWLWATLGAGLDLCWPALLAVAEGSWALFSPPAAPRWLVAVSLLATLAAVLLPGRGLKLLAGVLLATLLLRLPPLPAHGAFELTVLDVGHGLAAVVRTATHVVVFDTGPGWRGGAAAARVALVPYLRSLGVRQIDLVVVSHDDNDHAGGMETLSRSFAVPALLGEAAHATGISSRPCRAGDAWDWDGVRFTVIHPPAGSRFRGNDASCALRIDGPGGSAMLLADPESRAEVAMLRQPLAVDIAVVPHHGSATSSSTPLVAAVGASLALVSNGYGNRWGFPRPEVVQRWQHAGARVLTTAEGGAISVEVAPESGIGPARPWRAQRRRWWQRQ